MAIITDATGRQLAQAVGGIDTGGLVKDTTVQATNTALGNINTTEQSIATAINNLSGAISPTALNVSFDNTGTDITSSNVQNAIVEVNEKANTALQISNGSSTAYWGTTALITRPTQFKSMLIIGGRLNKGFMVFIPSETNEHIILSNINSCITSVSVTSSTIEIVLASSGYGSAIVINALLLI